MKRLICSLLALVLLLSLCPTMVLAAEQTIVWSGSGDEIRANITIDNTKNYELNYDLHLPGISTSTANDMFADDVMLKIRQTTADHYIIFRVKSYRNADGEFQIQGQQQFYDGSWSAEVTEWSENMEAPVSDVHVRIVYDSAAFTYTWAVSDLQGNRLCGGTTDPQQLSGAFQSGTACELVFKRGSSGILPTNTVYTVEDGAEEVFDDTKTPADFGWETDDDNYNGWKVSADGSVLQVTYDGTNSKRIWKELITDGKNFSISFDVQILSKRVEVELLGVKLELNTEGGNGNQIYTKDTDWFDAANQECHVTMSRKNGGELKIKLDGDESVAFTKTVADEENRNLFLGVIDSGGSACFRGMETSGTEESETTEGSETTEPTEPTEETGPEPVEQTPGDFGWATDEESFNGWTATDAKNITADASKASYEGWIYKDLITDLENFTVFLDLVPELESSGSVKILGVELELDARHGHGNQVCVKLDRADKGWLEAQGRAAHIELKRVAGGAIDITITGAGNDKPVRFSVSAAEESARVSLCVYAGVTSFRNITVVTPDQPLPTYTVTWNVDGVETTETYEEGSTPSFKGDTSKAADGEYVYTFSGWDPEIAPVTADVTYTAQYDKTAISADSFQITWDVAGKTTTEIYAAGELPSFRGDTSKAADAIYTYEFIGWDKELALVTADVTYTAVYSRTLRAVTPDGSYADVKKSDWFCDDVYTAIGYGLLNGTAPGVFSPEENMTRGMLVTVLYRLEGKPEHTADNPFKDVDSGDWYYDGVLWAAENGIVNGVGDGAFEPNGSVTREQIATILLRYAEKKGYDVNRRESIAYFPDSGKVSGYARQAMSWAVAVKLIQGSKEDGKAYLKPQGSATRAQVATILVRFIENIAN